MSMTAALSNFHWRGTNSPRHIVVARHDDDDDDGVVDVEVAQSPAPSVETPNETPSNEPMESGEAHDNDDEEENDVEAFSVLRPNSTFRNTTLRVLEEERELARRRTSVCLLLGVFLLFRLWIEALTQADFGLLMLCLVGTSWCARFIRHNREREEELDRRIQALMENNDEGESRPDFRMLSFQAQLALAIMESQRQMMQGGFGHPDGNYGRNGVSDDARSRWERFNYKSVEDVPVLAEKTGEYGSVHQNDTGEPPSCTICLGDYEDGEELVKLPCGHTYHNECIAAWTAEHTKCPLCNFDLETAGGVRTGATNSAQPVEID